METSHYRRYLSLQLYFSGYKWCLLPQNNLKDINSGKKFFRSSLLYNFTHGSQHIHFGFEAFINLKTKSNYDKSLKSQIKRGLVHGQVIELLHQNNLEIVENFLKRIERKRIVNLKNIYPTTLDNKKRIFIYRNLDRNIKGFVSISEYGDKSWYVEQLTRDKNAPNGMMEAIIFSVISKLRLEKQNFLSLGEVPFIHCENTKFKGIIFTWIGKHILIKLYNFEGLFHFKNKFAPTWKPVYLYGIPKLSSIALIELILRTNIYLMIMKGIFRRVRKK